MLITQNGSFLRSGFSLPASAVDGKAKFALSMWVYWDNRSATDNNQLIGELLGSTTTSWTITRNSTGRIQCSVAVNNGGSVQRLTAVTLDKGSSGGSFYHLFCAYEASTGVLSIYVNGSVTAEATANAGATGRAMWTTGAARPVVTFFNNADEWRLGETVLWLGDSIPAPSDMQDYNLGTTDMDTICSGIAPVARYKNIQDPTQTIDSSGEYVEDTSGNDYHLVWTSGSAVIDNVLAGATPTIEPFASEVTTSGELLKVSFRNIVGESTAFIVDKGDGVISLRRKEHGVGDWSAPSDCIYYARRGANGANSNVLWIVIPSGLRATGADDLYEITFADSSAIIAGAVTQWSASAVLTPTNSYGVEPYSLPDIAIRKPINSSLGAIAEGDGFIQFVDVMMNCGYWSRVATYAATGIPETIVNGQPFAFVGLFANFVPTYNGIVHLMWRGSPASVPKLMNGSSVELDLEQAQDTIDKDGQTWNRRTYEVIGTGCSLFIYPDGSDQFNLTHVAVVRDEQFTSWQDGEIVDSKWSINHRGLTSLRWMDTMHAVNCNAWNESHFLSESYGFPKLSKNSSNTEATYAHTVTAQETYTGDGYFNSGTILKLTLSEAHSQLKSGQRGTLSGFTLTGADTPSTVSVSIDTDNAGLDADEVVVRTSSAGTHSGSGVLTVTFKHIPPVWAIAGLQNASYAEGATANVCWVTRPHASTDAAWEQFVEKLDAQLTSGIEIWVEYSNETWNSAFEGQWRHLEGLARRNGATDGHDQHAASSYDTYKVTRAAVTSGRVVKLVIAGQSVTASVLGTRMGYLQARYNADDAPEKPATWDAFPVVMSTSNYFDFMNGSGLSATTYQCNRDAVANLTANGTIDLGYLAYRDLSPYIAIKATYGKILWAYEGGPNWDVPNEGNGDFTAVTRVIFAAAHHPRMANIMWGAWELYVTEGGFDGVSSGSHEADWSEITGKNWSNVKSWNQVAGVGDGSDGRYDNLSNLDTYIANGYTDPVWDNLVSTRAHAIEAWAEEDAPVTQSLVISAGGSYLVLETAV
jgi:hypothetical protein